ncbi:amino acid synthesis family protein [Brevibacterium casei]|uniref:Amino acid synthesis family protein n=1 Tax=Brevibacterium casei TaxID=33889 RepID=A0A7T2TIW2_9MICO|nr:amino acid synthesis family protein [Brevibacterium casei]MBE4694490.1 amino acid synthesis family protein [Brevibacterium casei]MBY3577612.1 amino acid synthesis family protein [Brevibacterium casei]QPS34628.1 amino acid synthesis family protein [Brevibacterium casei]
MSAESMIGVAADSATDEGLPQSFEELARRLGVRSLTLHRDEILSEAGTELDAPLIQAAAVAVVSNPWTGTGPDEDLGPATEKLAPVLAKVLTDRLLLALGAPDRVEAFGKAAVVGTAGELEHAGALIHTPYFGNIMREMLDGTSVLCFADGRAAASASIRVPMWHKTHATSRDHYQSIEVRLPDAPHADEICIIAAASSGPRPFARIGDRRTDGAVTTDILKGLIA